MRRRQTLRADRALEPVAALNTLRPDEQAVVDALTPVFQTAGAMRVSLDACHSVFLRGLAERHMQQDGALRWVPTYRVPQRRRVG